MARLYIFTVLLSLITTTNTTQAEDDISLDQFKARITKGEQSRDYSDSLFNHNDLLDLVDAEEKRKAAETGTGNRQVENTDVDNINAKNTQNWEGHIQDGANENEEIPSRSAKTVTVDEFNNDVQDSPSAPPTPSSRQAPEPKREPLPVKSYSAYPDDPDNSSQNGTSSLDPLLLFSNSQVSNDIKQSTPSSPKVKFGITIGSEIDVKLVSGANNIQPGYVVFEVLKSVSGYVEILPAKSLLFGQPQTVVGDDRLYVKIIKGITPFHDEFQLSAFAVGNDEKPGLLATIRSDGKSLKRASTDTLFSAVDQLSNTVANGNIPITAGKEGLRTLLNEKEGEANNSNGTPAYIVEADIQYAKLSVVETF